MRFADYSVRSVWRPGKGSDKVVELRLRMEGMEPGLLPQRAPRDLDGQIFFDSEPDIKPAPPGTERGNISLSGAPHTLYRGLLATTCHIHNAVTTYHVAMPERTPPTSGSSLF